MPYRILLTLIVISLLFPFCKSYSPNQLPDQQLIFGKGGGFSGIETSYTLLNNGQLFKSNSADTSLIELKKIAKSEAKRLFSTLEAVGFDSIQLNSPGNLYQFIESQTEGKTHKVVWGADESTSPIPEALKDFYKNLMDMALAAESN